MYEPTDQARETGRTWRISSGRRRRVVRQQWANRLRLSISASDRVTSVQTFGCHSTNRLEVAEDRLSGLRAGDGFGELRAFSGGPDLDPSQRSYRGSQHGRLACNFDGSANRLKAAGSEMLAAIVRDISC